MKTDGARPVSLFVYLDCGLYLNHHNNSFNNQMCCTGMTAIRQVQKNTMLNLQQHTKQRTSDEDACLSQTTAQHWLLQQLICQMHSPRQTVVDCFCPSHFFPHFQKNDSARDKGCLAPAWTVICAFCLQGDNGGMTTISNMTHSVSREEDGLKLTCEAFNKGTRFSKTQTDTLIVYCESVRLSWPSS